MNKEEIVTGLIFEAIIEKAISDKRDLLKPSMQHFIDGGNVNGQFLITLIKLLRWTERKTLEVAEEYATQQCAAKDAEIERLKTGLRDIARPMDKIRDDAEKEGNILNGMMALQLCSSANWLKEKAEILLNK